MSSNQSPEDTAAPLFSLIYVSTATQEFSQPELLELMNKSVANNAKRGITGMLLFKDMNFMQVLEGPEAEVRAVHQIIMRDPRHKGLITLIQEPQKERQFAEWSMGFRNLNDPQLRGLSAYSEFMNTPLTNQEFVGHPGRSRHMLLSFKRYM